MNISPIILALKNSADKNTYLPMQGLEALRSAIANDLNRSNGNSFKADDIVIGPGTKELMFLTQIAFDGDILLPAPSWVSYQPQALIAKNKVYWIQTNSNTNWFPTAKQLEEKVQNIKSESMLLFINYNNYLVQYKLENTQLRHNYHKLNLKNDWARSAR